VLRAPSMSCMTWRFYSSCPHSLISVFLIIDLSTSINKQQNTLIGDLKCAAGPSLSLTVQWALKHEPKSYDLLLSTEQSWNRQSWGFVFIDVCVPKAAPPFLALGNWCWDRPQPSSWGEELSLPTQFMQTVCIFSTCFPVKVCAFLTWLL
jgi:hypothetical protein